MEEKKPVKKVIKKTSSARKTTPKKDIKNTVKEEIVKEEPKKVIKEETEQELLQKDIDNLLCQRFSNVYFVGQLNVIGGIETFLYELVKKYCDKDLTIIYTDIPEIQLKRLNKYARTIKYIGQKIKCKKAFFNYNTSIINNIEAEEYIEIIHADFKKINLKPNLEKKIDKYYGVSKQVCQSFTEITGKSCELCYNPLTLSKSKRVLTLLSATRLSPEKGRGRMEKLAKALDQANIPYIWYVFTDSKETFHNPNIICMKPRLDIRNFMAAADYVVQLSDTEGYSYTVLESLSLGTPVIITPVPCFKEMKVDETNSIILDFDMKDIPVEDIYNKHFHFDYQPNEDQWENILSNENSGYHDLKKYKYIVEATSTYQNNHINDAELKRVPKKGETWEVEAERVPVLLGRNALKLQLVNYKGKVLKDKQEDN